MRSRDRHYLTDVKVRWMSSYGTTFGGYDRSE